MKRFAAEARQVVLALGVVVVVLFGGQLEHRRGELRGTHLEGQRTGQSRTKELSYI
jgi:hypothetical protein